MSPAQAVVSLLLARRDQGWGTGDFNGDGYSDIVWRNVGGTTALWEMDGGTKLADVLDNLRRNLLIRERGRPRRRIA